MEKLHALQDMSIDQLAPPRPSLPAGFAPSFLRALQSEECKSVMIAGCGGGFDFTHSGILIPELKRLGKEIVILSYSFGSPKNLSGDVVYQHDKERGGPIVKLVDANSTGPPNYQPEIGYCKALDDKFGGHHEMYATYARDWTISSLSGLYKWIVKKHAVDTLIVIDGGSDSMMKGDEYGLGDPIEDAVSVGAAASLRTMRHKFLISVGFGADRYNSVSDVASLRAMAEITKLGGFRGSIGVEPDTDGFLFYQQVLNTIYEKQTFRSVLSSLIVSSGKGEFGAIVPENSGGRVQEGAAFVWPLMSHLFAFDVDVVAKRSLIVQWIAPAKTVPESQYLLHLKRKELNLREDEGSINSERVKMPSRNW